MKPRNYVNLAMQTRRGGAHDKSNKSKRRSEKVKFQKNMEY